MGRKISNREMLKIEKAAKKRKDLPHVTGRWLYCCGTIPLEAWDDNPGELEFYTSVKFLKRAKKCWKECGIIKVKLTYYGVAKGKL